MTTWKMGQAAFQGVMPHHQSMKALWETKWKFPCTKEVYPFHDGKYEDFAPIFEHLIKNEYNDMTHPNFTKSFIPTAQRLEQQADSIVATKPAEASALYLRACAVLRIARFPYIGQFPKISCQVKWDANELQKKIYLKAAATWSSPVEEVFIPHLYAKGNDLAKVPVYVRTPKANGAPVPTVLLLTGLDGYRPDNTVRCDEFLARGWASVVAEIPGTADCPADPADPESPDRLWSSVLEWMDADGRFDMKHVLVWGLSCGGYYAVRIAHTHKDWLIGSIAQGAGVHHFFDREWMDRADGHEYPAILSSAMAVKHGFSSVAEYKDNVQKKFSLLETGIIQKPSTRLLLINGIQDGLMPIEDSLLLFEHGTPKEGRFFQNALHMGYPAANATVYPWMESVMASETATRLQ